MGLGSTNRKSILLRQQMLYKFYEKVFNFLKVIHNFLCILETSNLSKGIKVFARSIKQTSFNNIGKNTTINTKLSINYDYDIKSNCNIASGATLCGGVQIGKESLIGAAATLLLILNSLAIVLLKLEYELIKVEIISE